LLAEKNWESAENAERNLRADDIPGYDKVIELYRKVIVESPGTALTAHVEEKVGALERARRETSARVAFKEAGAKMEAFIARFSKSLELSGFEDVRQEIETVARLYADTEAAKQLSKPQLERLDAWKEEVDKVRPKFEAMRQEVSAAVEEKRFVDALAQLFAFSTETRENPYTPAVRDVADKIGRETVQHIVSALEEARNLRNRRQYEDALAALQGLVDKFTVEIAPGKPSAEIILDRLGVPALINRARKEMGEIRGQVETERTIAENQRRDTEKRMLEKAITDTSGMLHEYGFARALSMMEDTKSKLTIADYAAHAAWKIELFSRAEAIRQSVIARANKRGTDGLENPIISLGSMGRCKVIGAVETEKESVLKIEVPVAGGRHATMSWPWKVKELPPLEVFIFIREAWKLSEEEAANLATFCRVMSAIDPALESKVGPLCKDARKRATAEKNTKLVDFIDKLMEK
ncbi:MAG: hypothetical protein RDV41_13340, partial [Planctomycetota bacterium]|nr:hypothetical protein [Planctomycetota bacterium]